MLNTEHVRSAILKDFARTATVINLRNSLCGVQKIEGAEKLLAQRALKTQGQRYRAKELQIVTLEANTGLHFDHTLIAVTDSQGKAVILDMHRCTANHWFPDNWFLTTHMGFSLSRDHKTGLLVPENVLAASYNSEASVCIKASYAPTPLRSMRRMPRSSFEFLYEPV